MAVGLIANLAVKLTANTAAFASGLKDAAKHVGKFQSRMSTAAKKAALFGAAHAAAGATLSSRFADRISGAMKRVGKAMAPLGDFLARQIKAFAKYTAVVIAAGVALATVFVRRTLEAVDLTAKLARRLGMNVVELQRLRYAASRAGMGIGGIDLALTQFVRRTGEAQYNLSTYKRAFDELGLSAHDVAKIASKDLAAAFYLVIDRISELDSKALQASVSYNLFGRQGMRMLNLAHAASKGIKAVGKAVDEAGAAISMFDSIKIEMANDAFTRAKLVSQGFWQQLTVRLTPAIKVASDYLFDMGTEGLRTGTLLDRVFNTVGRTLGRIADVAVTVYKVLLEMNIGAYSLLTITTEMPQWLLPGLAEKHKNWEVMLKAALDMRRELDTIGGAWGGITENWWDRILAETDEFIEAYEKKRKEMGRAILDIEPLALLAAKADQLILSLRTPWQVVTEALREYWQMFEHKMLTQKEWTLATTRAWETYFKTIEKVTEGLRTLTDPASARFAPAILAGSAEAVRLEWRSMNQLSGTAAIAVAQQQLKIQRGIGETLQEQNRILQRGIPIEGMSILDVA
ncbi:MAG: hypothetical protein KAV00_02070 [Phycisphaerae bacterium]|nr:hypothetical protein [Phycisphaerae bacterium]